MTVQVPVFTDKVTEISADFANTVSQLVYGVFGAAGTAAGARLAMGLGTLAMQNANEVQIAGGSIDNTTIGFTTPANAKFNVAYILNAPVNPLHAVNKAYVDSLVAGAAANIINIEELYVAKIGSTMTGPLILSGDPVLQDAAATKHYVDQQITIRLASTLDSYQALREYNGSATAVEITAPLISGMFIFDPNDKTSDDNNGTIIIDTQGRRWKREFTDAVTAEWFGALGDGATEDEAAFYAAAQLQFPIALREGAVYMFGSTLTLNGGTFVLRNTATFKLNGGVIHNTDSNASSFTPILRLQGMTYVDLGTTIFDQNSLNQVYPATLASFGRGTVPFLHNGCVEITPDSSNTIPSQNVHAEHATFQNCYLNGLVLWQVTNAWVSENQFLNTGLNGVSACGVTNVRLYKNQGYRCGVSPLFPASQNATVHRSLIHVREFPPAINFTTEGLPCIITGAFLNGGISQYVEVSENYGQQCSTHTVYVRATIGLTGGRNRSYNVGYGRNSAAPYKAAHFWFEASEGANTENQGYQDAVQSGDAQPNGMYAFAMTGNANTYFPLTGNYRLNVNGARLHSAKSSAGVSLAGLLYTGLQASSNVSADYADIDGTTVDAIDVTNVSTYESGTGTAPHDVSLNNAKLLNVGSGVPILIKLTGTATGAATNIKAQNCTVDSGKEPITLDATLNITANPPVGISYSLGPSDWNVTSENVKSNFNLPFFRTATNTTAGTAALAGYEAIGDAGQTLTSGVTSSAYTGTVAAALTAFLESNAAATGGLKIAAAAGPIALTATAGTFSVSASGNGTIGMGGTLALTAGGNTSITSGGTYTVTAPGNIALTSSTGAFSLTTNGALAVTVYTSGHMRLGAAAADDGNQLQLTGMLGLGQYTTANLPATPTDAPVAFATDGAKQGETFPGTGIPVYFSNGKWRSFRTDLQSNAASGSQAPLMVGGTWDASANHVNGDTNTSLANSGQQTINTGTAASPVYTTQSANGYIYRNTAAGTTSIDGFNQWDVGDLAACIGGQWVKITVNFANVVFPAGTF